MRRGGRPVSRRHHSPGSAAPHPRRKRAWYAIPIVTVIAAPFVVGYLAEYLAGLTPVPGASEPGTPTQVAPTSVAPTSPTASAEDASEPPILIDRVKLEWDDLGFGNIHTLPKPVDMSVSELEQFNDLTYEEQQAWFARNGSVPLGQMRVEVVLRGNRDKQVRIMQITADKKCTPPHAGTIFWDPPGGAEDEVVRLGFDLDSDPTEAQRLEKFKFAGPYFSEKTISLKRDEEVVLHFYVTTEKRYCSFVFRADTLSQGQEKPLVIDNKGRPFELSAVLKNAEGTWDPSRYEIAYQGDGQLLEGDEGTQWSRMSGAE